MTRKSIETRLDGIIAKVAAAHGHDLTGRKGIDPVTLLVNGKVWEVLHKLEDAIVAATNPPATA